MKNRITNVLVLTERYKVGNASVGTKLALQNSAGTWLKLERSNVEAGFC
jgi:hypothetical protein